MMKTWQYSRGGYQLLIERYFIESLFSCTDLAGNQAETLVVPPFIIDKTAPVIAVMYDNQEVRNQSIIVNQGEQLLQSGEMVSAG